jgi:tRNA (mo5U34)-methyltransferase
MKAGNPEYTSATRRQIEQLKSLGWYHSIELPSGEVIPGFQSVEQLRMRVRQFPIPDDLTGKRVLDIGAWDGWFTFEMERRGASVVAADAVRCEKFLRARELLGSRAEYVVADVCDLRPADLGQFDIVLFLGVLYHTKHPLLALERVCALAKDLACVESYVTDDGSNPALKPSMEFYETTELCGQLDNWVGPNTACLAAFCRAAGFARVNLESVLDNRAHITCRRTWAEPEGTGPAPYIVSVHNSTLLDRSFSTRRDDYVSVWFKAAAPTLDAGDVFAEIGGYAARPVDVRASGGDGWHAIVKLPPGIAAGWCGVRVRVAGSAFSNTVRIGVDVEEDDATAHSRPASDAAGIQIEIVADGKTWERNRVHARQEACVSLWVRGVPDGCREADVVVRLGGHELPCIFLSEPDPAGLRQVNALLPPGLPPATVDVSLVVGSAVSAPAVVEIIAG